MEDLISKLRRFSKLDFQSKQELINTGRPTPELRGLLQTTGVGNRRETTRSFQTDWYSRKDWLCGCAIKNRIYCFPCLLFSTSETVWTQTGFCDLKNLPRSLDKHERSTAHIQNQISLKTFGTARIDLALNEQRRLNISLHNAKVKKNREILKDLINATCFLAKQELAFRGNDESASYIQWCLKWFSASYSLLFSHLILLAAYCMFVNLTCESVPPPPQPSLHVTVAYVYVLKFEIGNSLFVIMETIDTFKLIEKEGVGVHF